MLRPKKFSCNNFPAGSNRVSPSYPTYPHIPPSVDVVVVLSSLESREEIPQVHAKRTAILATTSGLDDSDTYECEEKS